jgi:hypothetical protein
MVFSLNNGTQHPCIYPNALKKQINIKKIWVILLRFTNFIIYLCIDLFKYIDIWILIAQLPQNQNLSKSFSDHGISGNPFLGSSSEGLADFYYIIMLDVNQVPVQLQAILSAAL